MTRVRLRDRLPEALLVVATTVAGLWGAGRWVDPTGDPGLWWSLAWRLGRGERYARDLYVQYWPLSPQLLSLVGRGAGLSSLSYLLIHWVPAIGAGIVLLIAARPHLNLPERLAVAGLVLGLSIFAPGPGRLVFSYCPAAVHALCFALLALLLLGSRGSHARRALLAGALAGLAFCSKQEIGIAAIVALTAPIWTRAQDAWRWAVRCLAGFAGVAAAGLLFLLASAPIESLRADSHLWPLAALPEPWAGLFRRVAGVAAPGWQRSVLIEAARTLYDVALVAMAGLLLARDRRPRRWGLAAGLLVAALAASAGLGSSLSDARHPLMLSMSIAFLVALLAWLDGSVPGREALVGYGLFAGLVGMRTAFSGAAGETYDGVAHLPAALTWALFLFVLLPRLAPGGEAALAWTRRIWAILLLPLAWYGAWIGASALSRSDRVPLETRQGRVWAEPLQAAAFQRIERETRPGQRVLVLPETNAVDVLYGLRDVSPFLNHLPGWLDPRAERMLIERLEKAPPDRVVIFDRDTEEFGVAPFGKGFGVALADWVERRYRIVSQIRGVKILRPSEPEAAPGAGAPSRPASVPGSL